MKNLPTILLLGLIAIVGVFTLDVYLPGMPAIAKDFGVSIDQVEFTFTSFAIVFAICQIFYGSLSDYFGRKPILVSGLIVSAVATLFCITAKNYDSLLIARILQATGISVFVVVNAIIRDLYAGPLAVQVRTFIMTVAGLSISLAPTIGGLLQNRFSWQGGFIASLVLIIIALICSVLFYKESNKATKKDLKILSVVKSYGQLFSNLSYSTYIFSATLAYAVHFTFIIMSANMFINILGFSPLTFGYLMFVYGGIYFVSGLLTSVLIKKISNSVLIKIGCMFIFSGGLMMLILSLAQTLNAWQILLSMGLITAGITGVRSAAATEALAPIPNQAGQGSAGLNLVQYFFSAILVIILSKIEMQPAVILSLLAIVNAITILSLINFLQWIGFSREPVYGVGSSK
jgi:DHA1 family bicyclomycin/chloramphenicol resistance-like MFS transporter